MYPLQLPQQSSGLGCILSGELKKALKGYEVVSVLEHDILQDIIRSRADSGECRIFTGPVIKIDSVKIIEGSTPVHFEYLKNVLMEIYESRGAVFLEKRRKDLIFKYHDDNSRKIILNITPLGGETKITVSEYRENLGWRESFAAEF